MKQLVLFTAMLAPLAALPAAETSPPSRPNIIFILADDLGIGNVSCYGADHYRTPNIDRLASGGIRYTHAYTAPLCGPSRAMIMTGRYAFRTGATNQDRVGLLQPTVETMLPKILKPAGYVSSAVGKWSQFPLRPADWGFDDYLRYNGSGVYWNRKAKGEPYVVNGESRTLLEKEYMPDLMHQHVTDFITKHRDDPFFVYYSLSCVHGDLQPTPDSAPDSRDLMADNIAYMDKLVGRLVTELERLKLREKTLIVFMGDNGTGKGQADQATIGGRRLSGEKGTMLEGGALVPLIVNWPGVTPAGTVATGVVDSTDFVPTFAELARVTLPESSVLDGYSLVTHWCGGTAEPRDWVFIQLDRNWYVREAGWKLNQAGELFDMSDSPFAEKLLAADTKDPAAVDARHRLQAVLEELNPAGGILDDGDGTGRHANKDTKKTKSK
jgi:arylsulfatase A